MRTKLQTEVEERVWAARVAFDSDNLYGYLVTEGAEPDSAPVAFIVAYDGNDAGEKEFQSAVAVKSDPGRANRLLVCGYTAIDLRPYCRPESTLPPPRWLWALELRPVGADGTELETEAGLPLRPVWFCPVMLAAQERKKGAAVNRVIADAAPATERRQGMNGRVTAA